MICWLMTWMDLFGSESLGRQHLVNHVVDLAMLDTCPGDVEGVADTSFERPPRGVDALRTAVRGTHVAEGHCCSHAVDGDVGGAEAEIVNLLVLGSSCFGPPGRRLVQEFGRAEGLCSCGRACLTEPSYSGGVSLICQPGLQSRVAWSGQMMVTCMPLSWASLTTSAVPP